MATRIRDPFNPSSWYEIEINNVNVDFSILSDVVIDEQEDMLRTCNITLWGKEFVNKFARFQRVKIYGGSADPLNRSVLFIGVIKQINTSFPSTGIPIVTVIGYGNALRGTRTSKTIAYPSKNCIKQWATKDNIKLSDIVKGILGDTFSNTRCTIDIKKDREFTYKKPFIQNNTDWITLRELARQSDCLVAEINGNRDDLEHPIIFVDRKTYITQQKQYEISFRYLERKTDNYQFITDHLNDGEIAVDSVDFTMNVDLNSGSLRKVFMFDPNTGRDDKLVLQQYDEKGETFINYELKPDAQFGEKYLSDEKLDKVWKRLTYEWEDVTFDEIKEFFNPIDESKNTVDGYEKTDPAFDGAGPLGWIGYEITLQILGDVSITPYRSYAIYGVDKYSTLPNGNNKWFLRSLQHQLGADGYRQTLNFYR